MAERTIAYWNIPEDFEGIIAYNPRHDIQDYLDLKNLNGKISATEYTDLLTQTNNRTKRQLEKTIGERFGVEKSTIEYFFDEQGQLKSPDYNEDVVARYEKGKKFLSENGSTETERETAEVDGIKKVKKILKEQKLAEYQSVIIISPPGNKGSLYTENFFDVWTTKSGKIIVTRYHSIHSLEGYLEAAKQLDQKFRGSEKNKELTPAYFLEKPLISNLPQEQILELLKLDKDAQEYQINQQIIESCTPFILSYIRALVENPLAIEKIKLTLNAIYNLADETEKSLKPHISSSTIYTPASNFRQHDTHQEAAILAQIASQIDQYGNQAVRTVNRGCPGSQKGFTIQQSSLTALASAIGTKSVADFAQFADNEEDEDTSDFQCPGYKVDEKTGQKTKCMYIVQYGSGIKKCPSCGMEATCA